MWVEVFFLVPFVIIFKMTTNEVKVAGRFNCIFSFFSFLATKWRLISVQWLLKTFLACEMHQSAGNWQVSSLFVFPTIRGTLWREGFTTRRMRASYNVSVQFIVYKTIESLQMTLTGNLPLKMLLLVAKTWRLRWDFPFFGCSDSTHKVHFRFCFNYMYFSSRRL